MFSRTPIEAIKFYHCNQSHKIMVSRKKRIITMKVSSVAVKAKLSNSTRSVLKAKRTKILRTPPPPPPPLKKKIGQQREKKRTKKYVKHESSSVLANVLCNHFTYTKPDFPEPQPALLLDTGTLKAKCLP